jgi:hypothetical protein
MAIREGPGSMINERREKRYYFIIIIASAALGLIFYPHSTTQHSHSNIKV